MGVLTSRLKLLKPDRLETVDVVTGINNNYDILDAQVGSFVCTSTTRPGADTRYTGQQIFETDTGLVRIWNGTKWQLLSPGKVLSTPDAGFPVAASAATVETVVHRITVPALPFACDLSVMANVYATYTQANELMATIYSGSTSVGRSIKNMVIDKPFNFAVVGTIVNLNAGNSLIIELRVARNTGTGSFTTSVSSGLTRMAVHLSPSADMEV